MNERPCRADCLSEDATGRYLRSFEEVMVAVRWIAVASCILVIVLKGVALPLLGWLATACLSAGNLALMVCIRRSLSRRCYSMLGAAASALEWLTAGGMALACSTTPFSPAPAMLVILLLVNGMRFGPAGVLGAWFAGELTVAAAVAVQTLIFPQPAAAADATVLVSLWAAVLAAAAVVGLLLRAGQRWLCQEQNLWERERVALLMQLAEEADRSRAERDALRRLQLRISPRELEVLGLIADGVSCKKIAERLAISEETARTHTRHLARKLGLPGERRGAIVAAARAYGLLPQQPDG